MNRPVNFVAPVLRSRQTNVTYKTLVSMLFIINEDYINITLFIVLSQLFNIPDGHYLFIHVEVDEYKCLVMI